MDRSGGKAVTVSDRKRRGAPAGAGLWITSLTGAAVSVLSGLIALLLAAFVAYASEDPDSIAFPLSAAALYIGALAGGIVCSRRAHRTALAESAIAGPVQSALMLIVSVFQSEHYRYSLLLKLLLHAGVFAAYMLGAYLARPRIKRPGRSRAARKRRA